MTCRKEVRSRRNRSQEPRLPRTHPLNATVLPRLRGFLIYISLCVLLGSGQSLASAQPAAATPSLALTPDPTVVRIRFPSDSGSGRITVSELSGEPKAVILRAQPMTSGPNVAFVQFPANANKDFVQLDAPSLSCMLKEPCEVHFDVVGVRAEGIYQGTIDAFAAGRKLASANVSTVRPEAVFQPLVSGDVVKNGRIEFDATASDSFVLSVQNPPGSPWRTFILRDCSDEKATVCTDPTRALAQATTQPTGSGAAPKYSAGDSVSAGLNSRTAGLVYSPSSFLLGPGKSQVIIARALSLGNDPSPRFLQIADSEEPSLESTTLVNIKKLSPPAFRTYMLLLAVILGAILSVILNNIFPTSWARSDVEASLRRVAALIAGSPSISGALRDALSAEISRNRLILRGIRFYHVTKAAALLDVQQAAASLLTIAGSARTVSALRSQTDSAALPVRTKLAVERALKDAEEALIGLDSASAAARLAEATRAFTIGGASGTLAVDLASDIQKLLRERGNTEPGKSAVEPKPHQPRAAEDIQKSRKAAVDAGRKEYIAQRLVQLEWEFDCLPSMHFEELLEVERDFYILDVWTEFVEPALKEHEHRFSAMADELLVGLRRNPVSDHVQLGLLMIQSSMTPGDLRSAIEKTAGFIECNDHPRYLDTIDCRFVFRDPSIQAVSAARRFVSYQWMFDDGSESPADFERCRHYFVPPSFHCVRRLLAPWVEDWSEARTRTIKVKVSVPGRADAAAQEFVHTVQIRDQYRGASELGWLQVINFGLSTSIAVLAAFAAQYGSALPDALDWKAAVAAFMFGFGLDQIRDKTTTGPASPRVAPAAGAQTMPATTAATASAPAAARTP